MHIAYNKPILLFQGQRINPGSCKGEMGFVKLLLALTILCSSFFALAKPDIWIDADLATGLNFKDVDDGYTLAHALKNYPDRIAGISYSFGNTNNLSKQKEILETIFKLANTQTPYYKGPQNGEDLMSDGSKALARFLKEADGTNSITILALSRTTIIEGALRIYPEGAAKIKEILFIGGRLKEAEPRVGKHQLALPDANFWGDEKTFNDILERNLKIVLVPADIALKVKINNEDLQDMKKATPISNWLAKNSNQWMALWKIGLGQNGFSPFDLMASAYMTLQSEMICHEDIPLLILPLPDYHFGRKGKHNKNRPVVSYDFVQSKNKVKFCYDVKNGFKENLMRELLKN